MYESKGKEAINLEMTSVVFAITREGASENQLCSVRCLPTPYILERKFMISNVKSHRCNLGPKSSCLKLSRKEKPILIKVAFINMDIKSKLFFPKPQ